MCRSEACLLPTATVLPTDMPFPRQRAQPMKPKLPRKLATSARINLNKYWHALEELMPVSCRGFDESDTNAINENLDNERRLAAMRISETQGVGSSDNCIIPSVSNTTMLGKKSSTFLTVSTTSSNVLLDNQSSSSSSLMSSAISTSSSKTYLFAPEPTASSCVLPPIMSSAGFPDENTPPLNGSLVIGGNTSQ